MLAWLYGISTGRRSRAVVQALLGAAVGLGLGRVGVDHQVDAAGQVVDDDQLVHVHQHQVRRAAFHAGREGLDRRAQAGLDVAHRVVAEIARQAAAETRHAGAQRDLKRAWYCSMNASGSPSWVSLTLPSCSTSVRVPLARITVRAGRPMNE